MKVKVYGFESMSGTSFKTDPKGKPYAFAKIFVPKLLENRDSENYTRTAAGFSLDELQVEEAVITKLKAVKNFPCDLVLKTEHYLNNGKIAIKVVDCVVEG